MGRRGGRSAKDQQISDNFNWDKKGTLKKDFVLARKAAPQKEGKGGVLSKYMALSVEEKKQIIARTRKTRKIRKEGLSNGNKSGKKKGEDYLKIGSIYQMLWDMWYVYKKLGGRKKLLSLMRDDKQLLFMVKEMLKIESAMKQAELRGGDGGEGGNQPSFFVVLKGLESEIPILENVAGKDDRVIDMVQVTRAINPDENSPEPEQDENKTTREAPQMLLREISGKGNQGNGL